MENEKSYEEFIERERNRLSPEEFFGCECHSFEHVIRLAYSNDEVEGDEIYLDKCLVTNGFLERLKDGLKYIFNIERLYGDFDSTTIKYTDYDRMISFLKKIRETHSGYNLHFDDSSSYEFKRTLSVDSCDNTMRIVASVVSDKMPWMNIQDINVFIFLKRKKSFFKRFWKGIRYIFGYECNYGLSDEFIIKENEAKHLIKIIENAAANNKKHWEKL